MTSKEREQIEQLVDAWERAGDEQAKDARRTNTDLQNRCRADAAAASLWRCARDLREAIHLLSEARFAHRTTS